jgi:hypothetical protein
MMAPPNHPPLQWPYVADSPHAHRLPVGTAPLQRVVLAAVLVAAAVGIAMVIGLSVLVIIGLRAVFHW